jgi:hypothetical protein
VTLLDAIKDSQLVKGKASKEVAENFGGESRENEKKGKMRKRIQTLWKGEKKEIL